MTPALGLWIKLLSTGMLQKAGDVAGLPAAKK
eukprot:CAMPEP_0185822946 /NCGR_PEP_ID=MMETSP1322-20130828/27434_1 /TAXON_ID=265543 /ORGANISM="Minutocellus polymorphus, Strain RCC2270" /LENGTH=31 /DNA_ID= /DNA_START= /DNA_END= /DNA_ORIENTATION=